MLFLGLEVDKRLNLAWLETLEGLKILCTPKACDFVGGVVRERVKHSSPAEGMVLLLTAVGFSVEAPSFPLFLALMYSLFLAVKCPA